MMILMLLYVLIASVFSMDKEFLDMSMKRMNKNVADCIKETGVTQEDLAELMEIKKPSTKQGRCMQACYHKKYGIQNSDGKLDKNGAMAAMTELKKADPELYSKASKLFDMCITEDANTDDECETAAVFMLCFNTNGKEMGLQPGMVPL